MGEIRLTFKKTDISFIVDPKGVVTRCSVTHVIREDGKTKETDVVVTLPGERFHYRDPRPRPSKARENH